MTLPKILVAIITHDRRIDADTVVGLLDFAGNVPAGWQLDVRFYMQSGQAMARNLAADDALKLGYTHLLFLDGDLAARWLHLERCLAADKAIACGTYAHKNATTLRWCNNLIPGEEVEEDGDFIKVREAGTGFMLIKVSLLETLIASGQVPLVSRDGTDQFIHAFFQFATHDGRFKSEDWWFCGIALDVCGERPWADGKSYIDHVGYTTFPLPSQLAENGIF